ncbi:MAG TPA: DUF2163 domain-containing protein [Pyrinomonadaceae bacterium]|nr:DUF2163 domain-containing protein [Pyrinomonadaceae bacterium]
MPNLRIPQNYQGAYSATSLITHLAGATLTVCVCAHVVSEVNGDVVAITSWSQDLTSVPGYPGVTFKSTAGITASKAEHSEGARPANMEADLFLVSAGITEADILAGVWVHATGTIFITNYEAVDMGQLIVIKGPLGSIVQKVPMATTEIQSWSSALSKMIGAITRPECANRFCDAACGLNVLDFTETGTLTGVTSATVFTDSARTEADGEFNNGEFVFTSGSNAGLPFRQIDSYASDTFTLRQPFPYTPQVGDAYSAVIGCQKRFQADCITRFSNADRFKGFPHVSTPENLLRLPTS